MCMVTRSGTPYHQVQAPSSVAMEQQFETLMRTLTDQMAQLNQNLTDQMAQSTQTLTTQMNHLTARLERVEARNPGRIQETPVELGPDPEFDTPFPSRRVPCQEILPEPNPRRPHHNPLFEPTPRRPHQDPFYEPTPRRVQHDSIDQDERALRNIRLDAPTFDGSLDPKVSIDWEGDMDQYFDWYEMSEDRKVKFAKLRLVRQARLYWGNVERMNRQRGDLPISTWRGMKVKLREKYLPMSYEQRLLDQ